MLAAGLGRRLYGDENLDLPKALLKFNDVSLIERHIKNLISLQIEKLTIVVGHGRNNLMDEVKRVAPPEFVQFIFNPRYREGPKLSLASAQKELKSGSDQIFMDADILYHPTILERLVQSNHDNCFTIDREFQSSDDYVKVYIKNNRVIDFGKHSRSDYDFFGEWPGILKLSSEISQKIAIRSEEFVLSGNVLGDYEEIFHDVVINSPHATFGAEDISGIPWIEIDNEKDLSKANKIILPLIE